MKTLAEFPTVQSVCGRNTIAAVFLLTCLFNVFLFCRASEPPGHSNVMSLVRNFESSSLPTQLKKTATQESIRNARNSATHLQKTMLDIPLNELLQPDSKVTSFYYNGGQYTFYATEFFISKEAAAEGFLCVEDTSGKNSPVTTIVNEVLAYDNNAQKVRWVLGSYFHMNELVALSMLASGDGSYDIISESHHLVFKFPSKVRKNVDCRVPIRSLPILPSWFQVHNGWGKESGRKDSKHISAGSRFIMALKGIDISGNVQPQTSNDEYKLTGRWIPTAEKARNIPHKIVLRSAMQNTTFVKNFLTPMTPRARWAPGEVDPQFVRQFDSEVANIIELINRNTHYLEERAIRAAKEHPAKVEQGGTRVAKEHRASPKVAFLKAKSLRKILHNS